VQDSIYEDYTTDAITKIRKEYLEDDKERVESLKNLTGLSILKDIKLEDVKDRIQDDLGLNDQSSKEITLIILSEIFYPIKDFFPGIEDEILKLSGEIPKEKPKRLDEQLLKREEEMEEMEEREEAEEEERLKDAIIEKPIEDLIKEFPSVGDQQIGSQKEIVLKRFPVPMKPLVKYWLEDYKEKMGYYQHSNIDRVQYVYRDKNTRNMNEEERRQLNLVLKSSDEGMALPYSTKTKKVDFSLI
jgi:hypothetical protein